MLSNRQPVKSVLCTHRRKGWEGRAGLVNEWAILLPSPFSWADDYASKPNTLRCTHCAYAAKVKQVALVDEFERLLLRRGWGRS